MDVIVTDVHSSDVLGCLRVLEEVICANEEKFASSDVLTSVNIFYLYFFFIKYEKINFVKKKKKSVRFTERKELLRQTKISQ